MKKRNILPTPTPRQKALARGLRPLKDGQNTAKNEAGRRGVKGRKPRAVGGEKPLVKTTSYFYIWTRTEIGAIMSRAEKDLVAKLTLNTILSKAKDAEPSRSLDQLQGDGEMVSIELDLSQFETKMLREACELLRETYAMDHEHDRKDWENAQEFHDIGDCLEFICIYFLENWESPWSQEDDGDEGDEGSSFFGEVETFKITNSPTKLADGWTSKKMPDSQILHDESHREKVEDHTYGIPFRKVEQSEFEGVPDSQEREALKQASDDEEFIILKGRFPIYGESNIKVSKEIVDGFDDADLMPCESQLERIVKEGMKRQAERELRKAYDLDKDMTQYFDHVYGLDERPLLGQEIEINPDNEDKSFETHLNIEYGDERVYVNGLRQKRGKDYFVSGPKQITFFRAPKDGDQIVVDYI